MHKGHNHARLDPTQTGVHGKVCIDVSGWSTAPLLLLLTNQPSPSAREGLTCGLQEWRAVGAMGEQKGNNSSPRIPLVPSLGGTKLPAGRQPILSSLQLRPCSPTGSVTIPIPKPRHGNGTAGAHALPPPTSPHGCTVGARIV